VSYVMFFREQNTRAELLKELSENQALHQLLRLQTTALEVAANAIVITDSTGTIVWVNDSFCNLTGYPASEVLGQTPKMFKSGQHDEHFYWHLWTTIISGGVWRGEVINQRKDGSLTIDETVITPVRIDGKHITHFIAIKVDATERKKAERALLRSESTLRSMVENAPYGICWATADAEIIHANPAISKMVGYSSVEELKQIGITDLYWNPIDRQPLVRWLESNGAVQNFPADWKRKDETKISVLINGHLRQEDTDGKGLFECYVEDVTERVLAERELLRLNRALSTLSECDEALIHATDQTDLLRKVCSTVVSTGGYRFAWVGFAVHDERKHVRPVASAGFDPSYLEHTRFSWADDEFGCGPVGTAIKEGAVSVFHDIQNDQRFKFWRDSAIARQYASVISLPLKDSDQTFGALTIYSSESNAFNPAEVQLLAKLADNLSYGISSIENRREKQIVELTLRESEERYRFLFTRNPHPMWIYDLESRTILEVNEAAVSKYGYSREEFLSMTLEDLRPVEEIPKLHSHLADAKPSTLLSTNSRHLRKDGVEINVEIAAYRFLQNNRLLSLVSSVDVTERVRAEKALRASEESYRTLYEHNHAAVFHTSGGRLLDCNDAMCRMLGYTRQEFENLDLRHLYKDPEKRDEGRRLLQRDGKITNYQVELLRKDGEVVSVLANLNILHEPASKDIVLTGVMIDITEVRELQMQLAQSQKLEAVGQLTGGIAHDFNNLLMIINSYSELLLDKMNTSDQLRRPVEQILAAGGRAAALTRQLLAFSRKQHMAPIELQLETLVNGLSELLKRLIGEDIDLRTSCTEKLWAVRADPSQVEQVILNLVVNARDAMPNGGRIVISTANVVFDSEFVASNSGAQLGDHVALSVADSGTGISPELQARVFEPFFTTKGPGSGTGLGLSTVYGIVKQSGGYITLSSALGKGSTFTVYFPRVLRSESVPTSQPAPSGTRTAFTILVVEDEEATRHAICAYLSGHGFKVLVAADAEEALLICKTTSEKIDVLLTDVIMPGMNGADLASRIRLLNSGMAVIFMSGYTADVLVRSGINEDSTVVLGKPFKLQELLATLQKVAS
jgi:two-component system, cell cycle sensor histidine kinase and response regulator CckA